MIAPCCRTSSSPAADPRAVARHFMPRAAAVMLVAGAMLGLAGCRGGDDATAAAVPTPAPAPAPAPAAAAPGQVISATTKVVLSRAELDQRVAQSNAATLAGAARCDVELVEIVYGTLAPDGPATVSGAVMIPSGATCPAAPYPLVGYTRATDLDRARTMVDVTNDEVNLVAGMLAGQGYVVAATDYLGYNLSDHPRHDYLHADSEAQSEIDAMRAARALLAGRGIALSPRVLLAGYSQGGHASLATQRMITRSLGGEFALAAAGHMSGPYDLNGSVGSAVSRLPVGDIGSTFYIPFAVTSLQAVYGNLYSDPAQFFKQPYAGTVDNLFPGAWTLEELVGQNKLPLLLESLVTDTFVQQAKDPGSTLSQALRLNSPYDFAATVPTMFCGGSRDGVVAFDNARTASTVMSGNAAAAITLVDVENEPAYASLLPSPLVPAELLGSYHASDVAPLCLLTVRDRLFAVAPR